MVVEGVLGAMSGTVTDEGVRDTEHFYIRLIDLVVAVAIVLLPGEHLNNIMAVTVLWTPD